MKEGRSLFPPNQTSFASAIASASAVRCIADCVALHLVASGLQWQMSGEGGRPKRGSSQATSNQTSFARDSLLTLTPSMKDPHLNDNDTNTKNTTRASLKVGSIQFCTDLGYAVHTLLWNLRPWWIKHDDNHHNVDVHI